MIRAFALTLGVVGALLCSGRPAAAQEAASLDRFVREVSTLWATGDVGSLVALLPPDGEVVLEIGSTSGSVQGRHAAAALRSLFSEGRSLSVRPSRITISGGAPVRGFGELSWTTQPSGTTTARMRTVYVGTVWLDGWRIRELRLLQ